MNSSRLFLSFFFIPVMLFADASIQSHSIAYDTAQKLVLEVLSEAKKRDLTLAVAVSDSAGHLVAFGRNDGTKPLVVKVALGKAYTAAIARNSTAALQELVNTKFSGLSNVEGLMPIQGGLPIFMKEDCIGGIGVSGTSAEEDEGIAKLVLKKHQLLK